MPSPEGKIEVSVRVVALPGSSTGPGQRVQYRSDAGSSDPLQ